MQGKPALIRYEFISQLIQHLSIGYSATRYKESRIIIEAVLQHFARQFQGLNITEHFPYTPLIYYLLQAFFFVCHMKLLMN